VKAEGKVVLELELAVNNAEEKGEFARKIGPEIVQTLEEQGIFGRHTCARIR
jgi:hypothetical protein